MKERSIWPVVQGTDERERNVRALGGGGGGWEMRGVISALDGELACNIYVYIYMYMCICICTPAAARPGASGSRMQDEGGGRGGGGEGEEMGRGSNAKFPPFQSKSKTNLQHQVYCSIICMCIPWQV